MMDFELTLSLKDLRWNSDWNGDEVGYPEVGVVGLYSQDKDDDITYNYYIDIENNRLLEFWVDLPECEG